MNHGSSVRFGPKPLTVKLLHRLDLDIHFANETSVLSLVQDLHENDEEVSPYIDLHSQEAAYGYPEPYSSEATLSHRIEAIDGHLMKWLLRTRTFRNALGSAIESPLTSHAEPECHWEAAVKQGDGSGRMDKVIAQEQLNPKAVAAGEWKTSLVMGDRMRQLAASLSETLRTGRQQGQVLPLEALRVFVVGSGHSAQLEIYIYPPSYPLAAASVAESIGTLIADAWAYGDVWDARIPVVTHDAAWGFCTRPTDSDLESGTEVAEVDLAPVQPSMGVWLAASALSELKARAELSSGWEMDDVLDDSPEEFDDVMQEAV